MFKTSLIASAALVALSFSQAEARINPGFTLTSEAQQKLEHLRATSDSVKNNADQLRMAAKNAELSPEGHTSTLETMRAAINDMGRTMDVLQAEHSSLSSWEQEAVAKTAPLLKNAAENTDTAINTLKADDQYLWNPVYTSSLNHISQDTKQMATILKDDLKLAQLRHQEQRLDQSLATSQAH